ncbi:surface protease GP63 [Trypanosoma theileri]|uniref:Leishmanolysin-like peptidase n=1 Tax=Trypanosoma theileri TaxID=67003 RepID=A0A1X0NU16_9TRYP|nr:surface protease GP63 [Trypanosoma theileri]ORC87973.1 surface protease GP63 [Trypanosoma theileri]
MRQLLYVTVLLLVLLPLYCTNGLAATGGRSCGFDAVRRRRGNTPVAVVRELPVKGQGPWQAYTAATYSPWAPIRIFVSTIDLEDDSRYCPAAGRYRPIYVDKRYVHCQPKDVLRDEQRNALINHIIPGAMKLHQERLLVKPLKGTFKVPVFGEHDTCSQFSVPPEHYNPGFSGYDTVMYAAAGPQHMEGTVAWAIKCATLPNGRPVTGILYFTPQYITNTSQMVRAAAHEMAHVLGFHGEVFIKQSDMYARRLRGLEKVPFLKCPKLVEKAKKHYNCSSLDGVEMENDGDDFTALSHWDVRSAKDELMAAFSGIGYYTALTMAAFECTRYYKANWGMEETMSWGKDAGCSLHTDKCIKENVTEFPDLFCTALSETPVCTSDRRALGICTLGVYNADLPEEYRYFTNPRVGGVYEYMTDYCPFISPIPYGDCKASISYGYLGSRIGPSSWCLKGESLMLNGTIVGDVCAEVQCDNKSVQVRYYGDDKWYPCPEGKVLKPNNTFTSGSIVCPKYREVCTIAADGSSRIVKKIIPEARHSSDTESSMGPTVTLESVDYRTEGEMSDKKEVAGFFERFLAALSAFFLFLLALFSNILKPCLHL